MSEEQTTVVGEQQSEQPQAEAQTTDTGATFLDTLPEDIRGEPSLKNFTNSGDLAKSFIHAQRMVGMDKIPVPGKHSTEDDWQVIYDRLGRPSDPNEYAFENSSFQADDPGVAEFKKVAHAAGLNPSQANKIMQFYDGLQQSSAETVTANEQKVREESELELRKDFGLAFDKKVQQADDVFQKFFPNEMKDVKLANGNLLGNEPIFIKALAKLADNFSEDSIQSENDLTLTPDDAQKEIDKLMSPGTPYWDKKHPGHQAAVEEVAMLQNMKHGIIPE
jgi:hypothetical protein|tara:strand:+ start:728 stop:1558 length:831 start_codon:yes stop_codon:yes gene_type:complete